MKYFFSILAILFICVNVNADENGSHIEMYGKKKYGFDQPMYIFNEKAGTIHGAKEMNVLANHEAFPFSSIEQGTAFAPVISTIAKRTKVYLKFLYNEDEYKEEVTAFERGSNYRAALFGVPKEYYPYSKNEYIYPAFFENKLHVITIRGAGIVINTKEDLLKYKGIYVEKDNLSSFIVKDFSNYKMLQVKDYSVAFEKLFTKEADYIVAGYYPSQIEAYKLGVRDYVSYSKDAIWKNPLFLRIHFKALNNPMIEKLKRYLRTEEFKQARDKSLEDVLEIYKKNTQGVIPPMYIGNRTEDETSVDDANSI